MFNKIWRWIARYGFPNCIRIWALRKVNVKIGVDVYIGEGLTLACDFGQEKNLVISDRVAIAPNVGIILSAHPNNSKLSKYVDKYSFLHVQGKVIIEHDSWIGMGAIILPGVIIGHHSVIGAGSIVTKDVPPFTVFTGAPAKKIRSINP